MAEKKTGFDKATGIEGDVVDEVPEGTSNVPRAVFTRDQVIDVSKLQISQLRVAQGQSAEVKDRKASVGQLLLSNFPAKNEVILVPLGGQNIRVYKIDPKGPAVCQAPTGEIGFGNPGGVCAECPLSHWGDRNEATGKSVPPKCKEGIVIRFYSVTHRCMVDFQFMAGDQRTGSFIMQQSMSFGWANFMLSMTTAEKGNAKGDWFVPEVNMLEDDDARVTAKDREDALKWYDVFYRSQVETKDQAIRQLTTGS